MTYQKPQMKRHQKMQANFIASLEADNLVDQAKARYQLAQKAFTQAPTLESQRYWRGYQDALQDVLQQAGLAHQVDA